VKHRCALGHFKCHRQTDDIAKNATERGRSATVGCVSNSPRTLIAPLSIAAATHRGQQRKVDRVLLFRDRLRTKAAERDHVVNETVARATRRSQRGDECRDTF
jgi:hypothetical protein